MRSRSRRLEIGKAQATSLAPVDIIGGIVGLPEFSLLRFTTERGMGLSFFVISSLLFAVHIARGNDAYFRGLRALSKRDVQRPAIAWFCPSA